MLRKASRITESRRGILQRRSRQVVLWSFGLFLAAQIATSIVIDNWAVNHVDGIYGQKARLLQRRLQSDGRDSLLVLALGSSRTMWGLETARLERQLESKLHRPVIAFNFANLGNGPMAQWIILRRTIEQGAEPDLVIVEVTPAFFTGNSASLRAARSGLNLNLMRIRACEMPLLAEYGLTASVAGGFLRGWLAPWYYHRSDLLAILAPPIAGDRIEQGLRLDPCGSQVANRVRGNERQYRRDLDIAMSTFARPYLTNYRLGGVGTRILEDMLAECNHRGIAAALVVIPEGTPLRTMYSEQWPEVEEWLAGLERRFGSPVIHARDWVPDDGFWDGHHMCRTGATTYTDRFCRDALPRLVDAIQPTLLAKQAGAGESR